MMSKKVGRHPDKALTALQVKSFKAPGRYTDGNGLYLVVEKTGSKRWMLRTVVQGKRRDIGLGGVTLVSLAEAREKALTYRKSAREGGDPVAERKQVAKVVPTFAEAVERVHGEHKASWKNGKHAAQWRNTLQSYALPHIGDRRVDQVDTPDVLRVLAPIWMVKQETARRVRQRLGTVFDWAKAAGFRTGDNPIEGVEKGLPRQGERDSHHAALPYAEVPGFVSQLRTSNQGEVAKLAFEFLILTAARTGEVIGAEWREVDVPNALWTMPAQRMKAGREHRVPISARALAILARVRELAPDSLLLFPGRVGKPLSNMAFLMALRRMKVPITAHGFRSSFRDWAAEETSLPHEVAEMALAHAIESRVEAAYRRGDLLTKRRELMDLWADFVNRASAPPP